MVLFALLEIFSAVYQFFFLFFSIVIVPCT